MLRGSEVFRLGTSVVIPSSERKHLYGWVFDFTSTGQIRIFPTDTRVDDGICLIYGTHRPCIIRWTEKVGWFYIHIHRLESKTGDLFSLIYSAE